MEMVLREHDRLLQLPPPPRVVKNVEHVLNSKGSFRGKFQRWVENPQAFSVLDRPTPRADMKPPVKERYRRTSTAPRPGAARNFGMML